MVAPSEDRRIRRRLGRFDSSPGFPVGGERESKQTRSEDLGMIGEDFGGLVATSSPVPLNPFPSQGASPASSTVDNSMRGPGSSADNVGTRELGRNGEMRVHAHDTAESCPPDVCCDARGHFQGLIPGSGQHHSSSRAAIISSRERCSAFDHCQKRPESRGRTEYVPKISPPSAPEVPVPDPQTGIEVPQTEQCACRGGLPGLVFPLGAIRGELKARVLSSLFPSTSDMSTPTVLTQNVQGHSSSNINSARLSLNTFVVQFMQYTHDSSTRIVVTQMAPAIPETQLAAVLENPGPRARITLQRDISVEAPGHDEILVKLSHSGIW